MKIFLILLCAALVSGVDQKTIVTRLEPLLVAADADKNGLDARERAGVEAKVKSAYGDAIRASVAKLLDRADADHDGVITEAEWTAFKQKALLSDELLHIKVMLPMRDGTKLATYVSLPETNGAFPVILSRTPYKADFRGGAEESGYVLVMQDQRGRFGSGGENIPFVGCGWNEWQDGVDTTAWIKMQPWCNGKIGTVGASALGITQEFMAAAGTEDIAAQFITVAAVSLYHHAAYHGGALFKAQVEGWIRGNKYDEKAHELYLAHPYYDSYWRAYDATVRFEKMNIPAIHEGGWFDTFAQGSIDGFLGRQTNGGPNARGKQKLVMGPWAHGKHHTNICAEMTFPNGAFPKAYADAAWFDHYLKGLSNGADALPTVAYYTMGDVSDKNAPGNEWRYGSNWPPASVDIRWYLAADKKLATNGSSAEGVDTIIFNPKDPCPTVGGRNLTIPSGPMDQRKADGRGDVICYDSALLASPVEVSGRIRAVINLSTSASNTDVHLRLCDVYPDGKSFLIVDGIRRLSMRESFEAPVPVEPGKTYAVSVDLWSTSIVFNKGHRIRLAVSASSYPRFDVNPGTGKRMHEENNPVIQTNRIVTGAAASYVVLPTVR
ncbi:MAG: CocE/NonD family hydrolase [Spirochaetes bacterium]|nr:CocE/NonD family hydrolase [Spirochaetota bacterium]